eukprot:Rhum_TRINITY_DN15062_c4_g3::Rhum_TRINITY_DN15062_c4_g3_i7::g.135553::m.135553
MASLGKSLEELIQESSSKKPSGGKGEGGKKGRSKGSKGGKGTKGAKGGKGAPGGRVAGGGKGANFSAFPTALPVSAYRSTPYQQSPQQMQMAASKVYVNKVYVAGIPADWTEADVLHVFETVGAVEKLTIFCDQQGQPAGSGMVQYADHQGMLAAVRELNGVKLGTSEIRVSIARTKHQAQQNKMFAAQQVGMMAPGMVRGMPMMAPGMLQAHQLMAQQQMMHQQMMAQQQMRRVQQYTQRGAEHAKKPRTTPKPKVEMQEVSKEDLDSALEKFINHS